MQCFSFTEKKFKRFRNYSNKNCLTIQVYDGNADRNSVIVNKLIQPIKARFVRLYPESWSGHISMRMELYGCEISSGMLYVLGSIFSMIIQVEKPLQLWIETTEMASLATNTESLGLKRRQI